MSYDVLIVGGGPSGSVAAANLMGAGLRVCILDRARFPRLKPCGGGISCRAYKRLPYLADVLRSVPTNFVHRLVFEAPSGDTVEFASDEPLYAMIRRIELDHALVKYVVAGGVELREDVTVARMEVLPDGVRVHSTAGEAFEAKLLIGTDGVNSIVAVQAGLRGPWPLDRLAIDGTEESPQTSLHMRQDTMYVYYGRGGAYGYGYLFPKATHVNFGIGYRLDYMRQHIQEKPAVQHEEFLEQLKSRGVLEGASQYENFHPWVLPVGGPMERLSCERVLVAGDAAGFVNGFTAEGIYYAMVSGELAGKAALAAFGENDLSAASLKRYDRACEAELGYELRKSVELQRRLMKEPRLMDSAVRFAQRSPAARLLLCAYGVGQIGYREMKRRALREALPAFLRYQVEKLWVRA
ncbi:MAG: NAD(P)/FAD-dependent oxidoreductase [Terracidiphilus sp.]|nr:NAD(P)/FAD-dependent oxidoreductase [Terracidiphilus sp.]